MSAGKPTEDRVIARALPPVNNHPDIACRGEDPRIFFPEPGRTIDRARAICGRCNHRQECLDWALDTEQAFGVWGGTSPEERHRLRLALIPKDTP